jgi:hypothetical protein
MRPRDRAGCCWPGKLAAPANRAAGFGFGILGWIDSGKLQNGKRHDRARHRQGEGVRGGLGRHRGDHRIRRAAGAGYELAAMFAGGFFDHRRNRACDVFRREPAEPPADSSDATQVLSATEEKSVVINIFGGKAIDWT